MMRLSQDLPVIDFFDGTEYDFLSNFHPSPVVLDDRHLFKTNLSRRQECATVEHAFQAAKSTSPKYIREICQASSPGEAKMTGRGVRLRPDWEEVKIDIMRDLVQQKFFGNPELGQQLLETAPALLVEGNTWEDRFWGVYEGDGLNWLGVILMETRNRLMVESHGLP